MLLKIKGFFIQPLTCKAIFEGTLKYNKKDHSLTGELDDYYGPSAIDGLLKLKEGNLAFIKQYHGKEKTINYYFERKEGDIWIGEFRYKKWFGGEARCELAEERETFKIDWENYIRHADLSIENEDKWAKGITQRMIDEGHLKVEKDPQTGEEVLIPMHK